MGNLQAAAVIRLEIFAHDRFAGVMRIDFLDSETVLPAMLFLALLAAAIWAMAGLVREFIPPFRHSRAPTKYLRMRLLARRGSAKACVAVADMLMTGSDGARHNHDLGLHYLQMALDIHARQARDGDGHALLKMAEIYEHFGRHARPHVMNAKADQCYRQALRVNIAAADAGDVNGMAFAGYQLYYGLGCLPDAERAATYLEGAARAGHAPSMKTLADYHMLGLKKKPDPIRAAALYRQAALMGDAEATERVGDHYLTSQGQLVSREEAYGWYARAARLGRKDAVHKLEKLEAGWTPKQVRDVQDRLRNWAPA